MKKLCTLITLLVAIVTGAQANQTDLISGITLPDVPATTYDLASGPVVWSGSGDDAKYLINIDAKGNGIMQASAAYYGTTSAVRTFATGADGSNSSASTSGADWEAPTGSIFFGSSAYKTATEPCYVNFARRGNLRTNRTFAYRFTGCSGISASVKSQGTTDAGAAIMAVYELDGTTQTPVKSVSSIAQSVEVITVDGLDKTKTYVAYIYGANNSNGELYEIGFLPPPAKTVATQDYNGVKKGDATLTEGTDFTKAENVITLASAYKTTVAPTDVKLINHKTYTDSSTEDVDVDVTFGATASEGFFSGSVLIGLTEYTVKVPFDNTPTLEADKTSVSVTSSKIATGTATIHISGVNLTGTTVDIALASAVEGLSLDKTSIDVAEGAVNADVTVSYKSLVDVAEANVNLTISSTGVADIVIPVTYSSTEAVTTITDVTEATTWDFSTASDANIASPDANNNVPFANAEGFNDGFNYQALSGKGQYFSYKGNSCYQGSQLKFHTTLAGSIVVQFSNTGSSDRPYRYLSVNGTVTEYKSKNSDKIVTEAIPVPAGDVDLVGIMGTTGGDDCVPTETENMLRIYSVAFTPAAKVATPVFAPVTGTTFDESLDFTITCETEGAVIQYSYDNETWVDYAAPVTITETATVYAKANLLGLNASDVATVTYTKNAPAINYSKSINIEQLVLDNGKSYNIDQAFLDNYIEAANINALDSLNDEKILRNEPYLGLKLKTAGAYIKVNVEKGKALKVKFGFIGEGVNVTINGVAQAEQISATTEGTIVEYVHNGADQEIVFTTSSNKTVVFKQIMIDEDIANVILPAPTKYEVKVAEGITNGTVAFDATSKTTSSGYVTVAVGDEVTVTATPAAGYELEAITVTGVKTDQAILVTNGKFTMPNDDAVVINATFTVPTAVNNVEADKNVANGTRKIFKKGKFVIETVNGVFGAAGAQEE